MDSIFVQSHMREKMIDITAEVEAVLVREREFWQGKCDTLERTIDEAVYKLYDLTPDEIKLVEKG